MFVPVPQVRDLRAVTVQLGPDPPSPVAVQGWHCPRKELLPPLAGLGEGNPKVSDYLVARVVKHHIWGAGLSLGPPPGVASYDQATAISDKGYFKGIRFVHFGMNFKVQISD